MVLWVMNLDFAGGGDPVTPPGMALNNRSGIPSRAYGFASNYRYAWGLACLIF